MKEISYLELKRNCKKEVLENFLKYSLAVVGTSSTQHLSTAIKGYAYEKNINLDVLDVDFNQLNSQFLNSESEVFKFNPNAILIYISTESLFNEFIETPLNKRNSFAQDKINLIRLYWDSIIKNSKSKILQYNFVCYSTEVFGSFAYNVEISFEYQIQLLNMKLYEYSKEKNVSIIDLNDIQSKMGREAFFDDKMFYMAKMPISLQALPKVAQNTVSIIEAALGKIKKCIILDLDNTLWGGVIGDDGLENIQIGELGIGQAFTQFQRWLKLLKERGILLAVCSKNNEEVAKLPFEKHPEMILKLDDFTMFVANWEDKASNIRYIQKVLNIGFDSMVFVDDNLFERNQVKSSIPEICVPDMPQDPALYLKYLEDLNLFETLSFSKEDLNRSELYKVESKRIELQQKSSNYNEFLKSLNMVAQAKSFDEFYIPRISQLTQRSNQFNLRTKRYDVEDIEKISKNDNYITRYFTLKDDMGEYGLISVLILEKKKDYLFIDTLLMSCRVLKRGMEEFIFNEITKIAKDKGYKKVIGEYIKTEKNAMVKDLYKTMGYKDVGNGQFELVVDEYKNKEVYIKE